MPHDWVLQSIDKFGRPDYKCANCGDFRVGSFHEETSQPIPPSPTMTVWAWRKSFTCEEYLAEQIHAS